MKLALITIKILCALLLANCTSQQIPNTIAKTIPTNADRQIEALLTFKSDVTLSPGTVRVVSFPYFGPFHDEVLLCDGVAMPLIPARERMRAIAYVSLSYFARVGPITCTFNFTDSEKSRSLPLNGITVVQKQYPEEELRVDGKRVHLSKADQKRVQKETEILQQIYLASAKTLLFDKPFAAPLMSKITTAFGTKRLFNSTKKGEHLGTDFRARVGTPITPANSGRVAFAGDTFYGGTTVIVDHGLGIFTAYAHLSKILVSVGDLVSRHTKIGLSGQTGRVSGPHLHWGVKIHGHWVDGFSLVEASQAALSFPDSKNNPG